MRRTTLSALLAIWLLPSLAHAADDLPKIKLDKLVKLDRPIEVKPDPTGRLFLIEQPGRAVIWGDGKVVQPPYLDLTKKVFVDYECGLLSIAFHPKFAE